tara:strand:+ start:306 stop:998 length:693 start_codon:yes stop_codon:yes gene_type:complete
VNKNKLNIDFCSHQAAKFAVERWHYSSALPAGKSVKVGVWENGKFVGVCMFGMGAGNCTDGRQYGLKRFAEVAELTRLALYKHETPCTKIVARSIKLLKKQSPKIRLIISFSDRMGQSHVGTIYQAGNWIYTGDFTGDGGYIVHGKWMHNKSVHQRGWKQTLEWLQTNIDPHAKRGATRKHRYLMPLDEEIKQRILPLSKPYPKRTKSGDDGDHPYSDGATPIRTLQAVA